MHHLDFPTVLGCALAAVGGMSAGLVVVLSVRRRRGRWLDRIGDDLGVKRWAGETNEDYATRVARRAVIGGSR